MTEVSAVCLGCSGHLILHHGGTGGSWRIFLPDKVVTSMGCFPQLLPQCHSGGVSVPHVEDLSDGLYAIRRQHSLGHQLLDYLLHNGWKVLSLYIE